MILHMDTTRWSISESDYMFLVPEDGETIYSQQKQDLELTVAPIMSSLLHNLGLNWRK